MGDSFLVVDSPKRELVRDASIAMVGGIAAGYVIMVRPLVLVIVLVRDVLYGSQPWGACKQEASSLGVVRWPKGKGGSSAQQYSNLSSAHCLRLPSLCPNRARGGWTQTWSESGIPTKMMMHDGQGLSSCMESKNDRDGDAPNERQP